MTFCVYVRRKIERRQNKGKESETTTNLFRSKLDVSIVLSIVDIAIIKFTELMKVSGSQGKERGNTFWKRIYIARFILK